MSLDDLRVEHKLCRPVLGNCRAEIPAEKTLIPAQRCYPETACSQLCAKSSLGFRKTVKSDSCRTRHKHDFSWHVRCNSKVNAKADRSVLCELGLLRRGYRKVAGVRVSCWSSNEKAKHSESLKGHGNVRFHKVVRISRWLFCASFLITEALFAAACVGLVTQPGQTTDETVAAYESPRLLLFSPVGPVSVTVTTRTPPAVPQKSSNELLWLLLGGVALAPLGFAAPVYAGVFVVGSAITVVGSGTGYVTEQAMFSAIGRAVSQADLPAALADTLRGRALPVDGQNEPTADGTVVVQGWGVAGECVVASVELSVSRKGLPFLKDQLNLTIAGRSSDAPPVQCASLSRFADDNGRLVRDTIRDYAEVLAVMVIDRLNRLQP